MPHAFKSFLKGQVVEELALVLQTFLNDYFAVEDLFHRYPHSSESSLLFALFCNRIKMMRNLIWGRSEGNWSLVEAGRF